MAEIYEEDPIVIEQSIEGWVITKCEDWRDYYESNYEQRFEEYYNYGVVNGILLTASVGLAFPYYFSCTSASS